MSFEAVVAAVRERVTPDAAERAAFREVRDELVERAEAALAERDLAGEVVLAGSTARGTWLAGDRDIDVFVCFPPDIDRETLEERGLAVGHAVLPDGREEYAEHPYVTGELEGFDVDLVPCYDLEAATEIRSAVDRTPFHTAYVRERLDEELAGEVRVAKQFLTAIGAYGSNLRTRGYSGYLVELLVLEYGGFHGLVEAAADWEPPVRLDPEGHGTATFDDPLVVIDPTDPERNVAAVLSAENVARLTHYARVLLAEPREALFEPTEPEPLTVAEAREAFATRGTTPVAVRFDAPDLVEDQLYPQLDRSLGGIADELDRRGFEVLRTARFADESAVLLVECAVGELPAVERHEGPPVAVRRHAEGFYDTYADGDVAGPFLDGDRYVVERERQYRTPAALLRSDALFDVALGRDIVDALRDDYEVLSGEDVAALAGEFGVELARYCDPSP